MTDEETILAYGRAAQDYNDLTLDDETAPDRAAFLGALPEGDAPVLDWGAGPGHDAAAMMAAGIEVEATDATPAMVALCEAKGVAARCEPFDALDTSRRYRGIWANFSLLHADGGALPGLITSAAGTLVPGGILHVALKRGQGSARDKLGRRYVYLEVEDLDNLTQAAGLTRIGLRHGRSRGLDGQLADYIVYRSRKPDA